jgi:hypothetical protein
MGQEHAPNDRLPGFQWAEGYDSEATDAPRPEAAPAPSQHTGGDSIVGILTAGARSYRLVPTGWYGG